MADEQITSSTANIPYVNFINVGSDQAAPSSGRAILYIKDGALYVRLDTGSPVAVGGVVALAEGRLAVGDASGELSALALGTEGQVVKADASGHATWGTDETGGGGGGDVSPINVAVPFYTTISSGTLSWNATASQIGGGYYVSPNTQAWSMLWDLWLPAGTYTLCVLAVKSNSSGIFTLKVDGTEVGTWDSYNSGNLFNQFITITALDIATSGAHTLSIHADTKNASSAGYLLFWTNISFVRTA